MDRNLERGSAAGRQLGTEALTLAVQAGKLASTDRESSLRDAVLVMRRIRSAFEPSIDLTDERWARVICETVEAGLREETSENRQAAMDVAKAWPSVPMSVLLSERLIDELEPRSVRLAAAASFEGARSDLVKHALITGIRSTDNSIVEACAEVATGWRDDEIERALYESLARAQGKSRARQAQVVLAEALKGAREKTVLAALVEGLCRSEVNATALTGVADETSVFGLLSLLGSGDSVAERRAAAVLATSPHPAARCAVAQSIAASDRGRISSEMLPALKGEWDDASARILASQLRRESSKEWLSRIVATIWPSSAEIFGVFSTTRWRCAKALGGCAHPEAIAALAWGLRHPDPQLRETCASSLRGLGDSVAVTALVRSLADSNPSVRSTAAESLRDVARQNAEVAIEVAKLLHDPVEMVRMYAARGLDGCLERLPAEPGLRLSKALGRCMVAARTSGSQWSYNVRRACLSALSGTRSQEVLLEVCKELRHDHAEIREMAQKALSLARDPLVSREICRIFEAGNIGTKLSSIKALRGLPEVVPLCKQAIGDGAIAGILSASVLADTPLPESKAVLLEALFVCKGASVATAVGGALSRFELSPDEIAQVRLATKHSSPFVRQAALVACAGISTIEVWGEIVQASKDTNPEVRASACLALRGAVSTDAVQALLDASRDPSPTVRRAALTALAGSVKAAVAAAG